MESHWYIVKVLPGKERLLREDFNKKISQEKIKNVIRFVCPTEKELKIIKNKKVSREKVLYNGYLYFETQNELTPDELKVISVMNGIMGLMGERIPVKLKDSDVKRIIKDSELDERNNLLNHQFKNGEVVKIIDGPFLNFDGIISSIIGEKVELEVKIFGRATPIELTIKQIEKF